MGIAAPPAPPRTPMHKLDGIGVGRIRAVPFSSDSANDAIDFHKIVSVCASHYDSNSDYVASENQP